jgi:hypothetical protein
VIILSGKIPHIPPQDSNSWIEKGESTTNHEPVVEENRYVVRLKEEALPLLESMNTGEQIIIEYGDKTIEFTRDEIWQLVKIMKELLRAYDR